MHFKLFRQCTTRSPLVKFSLLVQYLSTYLSALWTLSKNYHIEWRFCTRSFTPHDMTPVIRWELVVLVLLNIFAAPSVTLKVGTTISTVAFRETSWWVTHLFTTMIPSIPNSWAKITFHYCLTQLTKHIQKFAFKSFITFWLKNC